MLGSGGPGGTAAACRKAALRRQPNRAHESYWVVRDETACTAGGVACVVLLLERCATSGDGREGKRSGVTSGPTPAGVNGTAASEEAQTMVPPDKVAEASAALPGLRVLALVAVATTAALLFRKCATK